LREAAEAGAFDDELDYWLGFARQAVAPLPVDHMNGENTAASARSLRVELSETETQALLREAPAVYHTQINDVLLASLVKAYESWCGARALLVEVEGHGREQVVEDVDISRTVGWFTSLAPILLTLDEGATLGDALMSVKEQVRRIPRRGVGYGALKYLGAGEVSARLRSLAPAQISFNYLGQFDQTLTGSSFALARESSGPCQSLKAKRRYLIEVDGRITGGRLQLDWTYSEQVHELRGIERLAARFIETLRQLIERAGTPEQDYFTPSDFPLANLDQRQLSKLAALFKQE
jgi:non-ribosomal peptide synthase protein (TIGR01720 family)